MNNAHRLMLVTAAAALAASTTLGLQAQDVPESVLSCVATGTKVGHTWIQHSDPARLQEAVKVFTQKELADFFDQALSFTSPSTTEEKLHAPVSV